MFKSGIKAANQSDMEGNHKTYNTFVHPETATYTISPSLLLWMESFAVHADQGGSKKKLS